MPDRRRPAGTGSPPAHPDASMDRSRRPCWSEDVRRRRHRSGGCPATPWRRAVHGHASYDPGADRAHGNTGPWRSRRASRWPEWREAQSVLRRGSVVIDEPAARELLAHAVDVEPEFAVLQPFADLRLPGFAAGAGFRHLGYGPARHDTDTVLVGDDEIAGMYERAAADHRHIDAPQGLLDRALREDCPGPDGKLHGRELAHIANAGIDDERTHAAL